MTRSKTSSGWRTRLARGLSRMAPEGQARAQTPQPRQKIGSTAGEPPASIASMGQARAQAPQPEQRSAWTEAM